MQDAEGDAAVRWLAEIELAAKNGTWQAAAWKLERRYPQDYGRQVTERQGPDGGPVEFTINLAGPRAEALRALHAADEQDGEPVPGA
jgi:hypothetical protein